MYCPSIHFLGKIYNFNKLQQLQSIQLPKPKYTQDQKRVCTLLDCFTAKHLELRERVIHMIETDLIPFHCCFFTLCMEYEVTFYPADQARTKGSDFVPFL